MTIYYNKLWHLLLDEKMSRVALEKKAGISHYSMTKMSKNEDVTTEVLYRICDALRCNVEDIIYFIPCQR